MFEGGAKALHHGVVPATALGRHAAADPVVVQQLSVALCEVLAALIGVDQELIGFDLAVAQGPVEAHQHQGGHHGGAHGPADHPAAVQIDPDHQIPPVAARADVGDFPAQQRLGAAGPNSCCSMTTSTHSHKALTDKGGRVSRSRGAARTSQPHQ